MAGQGTIGIEIAEQDPNLDAVFIAVGAGGPMGGAGTALHALRPGIEVVGVWPEASPCMLRALEAGEIVPTQEFPTLSDGTLGAIEPGSITFPACQKAIDKRIVVDEAEIAAAMKRIAETERWMIEGAAGVAFAGLVQQAERYRGRKVAVVLCGRNIALDLFLRTVAQADQPGDCAMYSGVRNTRSNRSPRSRSACLSAAPSRAARCSVDNCRTAEKVAKSARSDAGVIAMLRSSMTCSIPVSPAAARSAIRATASSE